MYGPLYLFTNRPPYNKQRSKVIRSLAYASIVLVFLVFIRRQISEITVLQLSPAVFFFLCFIVWSILFFFSFFFFQQPIQIDIQKSLGFKTTQRLTAKSTLKSNYVVFFIGGGIGLNSIIPLSLDYFSNTSEDSLSALWSLSQVVYFEFFFILTLTILTQIPLFFIKEINTSKKIRLVPKFARFVCFLSIILAGIITPTIDGTTQLSVTLAFFSLYCFIYLLLQRRIKIKFRYYLGISE